MKPWRNFLADVVAHKDAMNKLPNVQECDASKDEAHTVAGHQKTNLKKECGI
jgi:hypothetical protein